MKTTFTFLFFSFLSFIYSGEILATTYTSIANRNWTDPLAWSPNGVPGASDEVIIDGYTITIDDSDGDITINKITITNNSGSGNSYLLVYDSRTLTVTTNIFLTSENQTRIVRLEVSNNTIVNVGGNITLERTADNDVGNGLELSVKDSGRLNVSGDVTYDYKNSKSTESSREFNLEDSAILDVTGNLNCYIRSGKEFELHIRNTAQLLVGGDLIFHHLGGDDLLLDMNTDAQLHVSGTFDVLNSGGINTTHLDFFNQSIATVGADMQLKAANADNIILVEIHGAMASSSLTVSGDITMDALSEGDVTLQMAGNSNLYLGGDIFRINNYGILDMGVNATLTYNNNSTQVLAASELPGNGTDAFNYTNVVLDNLSGFTLEDTLYILNNLTLTNGKITTTSTNILIIGDQATITGGSETAFVDGPMIKIGRSNNNPFLFPIGDGSIYAPLEISKISSSGSEYFAQYFGDPPPFGTSIASDVDNISDNQYWELSKIAGSNDVEITLYWMDAAANGINDLTSTIVVGLSEANVWLNFGNGGTTGSTGSGGSGSISSTDGDPPPFGVTKFTIGSFEIEIILPEDLKGVNGAMEVLPVELTQFYAIQQKGKVYLKWQTASEVNTSHFVVERSIDGHNFKEIETIFSKGESDFTKNYLTTDASPFKGINYYRLKIVDNDGWYEYSPIEAVNFQIPQILSIYPIPVDDVLHLNGEQSVTEEGILEVFGINGQRIYMGDCVLENGRFQISTNTINMHAPGNYIIRFTSAKGNQVFKINKF